MICDDMTRNLLTLQPAIQPVPSSRIPLRFFSRLLAIDTKEIGTTYVKVLWRHVGEVWTHRINSTHNVISTLLSARDMAKHDRHF